MPLHGESPGCEAPVEEDDVVDEPPVEEDDVVEEDVVPDEEVPVAVVPLLPVVVPELVGSIRRRRGRDEMRLVAMSTPDQHHHNRRYYAKY